MPGSGRGEVGGLERDVQSDGVIITTNKGLLTSRGICRTCSRLLRGNKADLQMNSDRDNGDDNSFAEFYREHHGCHPNQEIDQQYVKNLKMTRVDSKESRKDSSFEKRYEEWWKKCGKDNANLFFKEQMRSMVHFKAVKEDKE